jgi:hypothetical protein
MGRAAVWLPKKIKIKSRPQKVVDGFGELFGLACG